MSRWLRALPSPTQRSDDEQPHPSPLAERPVAWRRFAPGLCGVVVVVVLGLGWSLARFGSLGHAWLYANGVRLTVDNRTIQLPDGKPGEDRDADFVVRNLSGKPIQILGAQTSCGCVATAKLPVTVLPGQANTLRVTLHLEQTSTGVVEQMIIYHTDESTAPNLTVVVKGRVINP